MEGYISGSEKLLEPELLSRLEKELETFAQARSIEFELDSVEDKASFILNNFRFWLPGGWYREIKPDATLEQDVDEVIAELGFNEDKVQELRDNGLGSEIDYASLLKIFFSLRDRGHDLQKLNS